MKTWLLGDPRQMQIDIVLGLGNPEASTPTIGVLFPLFQLFPKFSKLPKELRLNV